MSAVLTGPVPRGHYVRHRGSPCQPGWTQGGVGLYNSRSLEHFIGELKATGPSLAFKRAGARDHLREVYDLNKRKRVAQQKHRARQRKIDEKTRAARGTSPAGSTARTRPAEPERMAPLTPTSRPPAPRRPRTTPRPAGAPQGQQGSEQQTTPRPPARPRRPAQPRPAQPEEPKPSGEAPSGKE